MVRGDNIPIDLVIEILSRLPAKSIARCRCVSKPWGSTLLSPIFTELFLTNSLARPPNLLFVVEGSDDWCFLTSPHPQNDWSLVPDFRMKLFREFCGHPGIEFCGHASGFLLFCRRDSEEDDETVPLLGICNPTTGQYASLPAPKLPARGGWRSFLGFDPIDKQFKLLSIIEKEEPAQILTLGTGNDSWREIHCPLKHSPVDFRQGICINGVLYYLAKQVSPLLPLIVCFDVRSEKFFFSYRTFKEYDDTKLVNYKGELGMISYKYHGRCLKLRMWVMKDFNNLESIWLDCFSFCRDYNFGDRLNISMVGVTASGEIVLSNNHASEPFYVIYINPESNAIQKVEIRGLGASLFNCQYDVEVFADYVENLNFITMMKMTKYNSVTTSTSSKAGDLNEDGSTTFKSIKKFDSLGLLFDDDECT